MLESAAERFLAEQYSFDMRQQAIAEDVGFSGRLWQQFAELGWTAIPFSEQYGGVGGAVADTFGLVEHFGRALVREPYISTIVSGCALANSSNSALRDELLPEIIAGALTVGLALDEADARGNLHFCACSVQRISGSGDDETCWRIKGIKQPVYHAGQVDYLLVSAQENAASEADAGAGDISLFLVPSQSPGLTLTNYATIDGQQAATVDIDSSLSNSYLLAEGGEAKALLEQLICDATLMFCAEALGIQHALLEATLNYTATRKQFGVPIATFQALRHRMADMYMAQQTALSQFEMMAESLAAGSVPSGLDLSLLKVQVNRSGRYIADEAVQMHGGIGMTDELIVGHYLKRLLALNTLLGGDHIHLKNIWAQQGAAA